MLLLVVAQPFEVGVVLVPTVVEVWATIVPLESVMRSNAADIRMLVEFVRVRLPVSFAVAFRTRHATEAGNLDG